MRTITFLSTLSVLLSGELLAQKLEGNADYKAGISALNDHLNDLAVDKFNAALSAKDLTEKDKDKLLITLAETYIRSSLPALAIQTLENAELKGHPDLPFWKGVATATAGKYSEAIGMLKLVTDTSSHYSEATLTLANLYQAVGDHSNALLIYQKLSKQGKQKLSQQSALRLAELYLTSNKPEEATKLINNLKGLTPAQEKEKLIIRARLNLTQKNYTATIDELTELLKHPENINARAYNNAIIALADARFSNGDAESALEGIFDYIEKNQDSDLLSSLFTRIGQWIPADTKLSDPKIEKLKLWAGRNVSAQESGKNKQLLETDLTAFAHFYYSTYLAQSGDPASLSKALFELSLLRLNHPTHITFGMSLMKTAEIQLKLELEDDAVDTLRNIQKLSIPITPEAKRQAAFILGELLAKKMNYAEASSAFAVAVDADQKSLAEAAAINTGLAYLAESNNKKFEAYLKKTDTLELKQQLQLERALWAAKQHSLDARLMLDTFIREHPEDLRISEAQLALAENSIRVAPIDPLTCKSMIEALNSTRLTEDQQTTYFNTLYLYAMSQKEYATAINTASQFLEMNQPEERKIEFQLLLGQAYYRNGQHNLARQTLLQLANAKPDSPLSDYALYYASLAARLEGTPQSQKEAIDLFKKVIDKKSPISTEATLQLADLYNDTNQPEESQKLLLKVYKPDSVSNVQRNIAIHLASSLQALGASDPENYAKAIQIYDKLLSQKDLPTIWFNRIHYSKGYTYEEMDKNQEAVNTYYEVINVDASKTPITEWNWYYRCGFNAIVMLEKLGNPKAAISVAKKLASTRGPRAEEASKLARHMEMKHMIWDNE